VLRARLPHIVTSCLLSTLTVHITVKDMHSLFGLALPLIPSSTSVHVASVHSFHESGLDRSYIDNSTTSYESNIRCLPDQIQGQNIYIITRGLSAVQGLMQPKQQSGQTDIKAIYQPAEKLLQRGNRIQVIWLPTKVMSQQQTLAAKNAARDPTRQEAPLKPSPY